MDVVLDWKKWFNKKPIDKNTEDLIKNSYEVKLSVIKYTTCSTNNEKNNSLTKPNACGMVQNTVCRAPHRMFHTTCCFAFL